MARCATWRPTPESGHRPVHLPPGRCTRCWRPCHNHVRVAGERCSECLDALLEHPSPAVRALLVDDASTPGVLMVRLANDPDLGVSQRARTRLDFWPRRLATASAGGVGETEVGEMESGW